MSLETWKKEFYRIPAKQVSKGWALRHSLRKWIGLRLCNRKKHKVSLGDYSLVDSSCSTIGILGSGSCALCTHFLFVKDDCVDCPLTKAGFLPCGEGDSPYSKFIYTRRTSPMIKALEKAQKKMREKR